MRGLPTDFRWPSGIEEKILTKHGLVRDDVEESFFHPAAKLRRAGDKYRLFTRTSSGDYIVVVLEFESRTAVIISARRMTTPERRFFRRK